MTGKTFTDTEKKTEKFYSFLDWVAIYGNPVKKKTVLHALHVRFSLLSISLPASAKQRKIAKFGVLWRTSALEDKLNLRFLPYIY